MYFLYKSGLGIKLLKFFDGKNKGFIDFAQAQTLFKFSLCTLHLRLTKLVFDSLHFAKISQVDLHHSGKEFEARNNVEEVHLESDNVLLKGNFGLNSSDEGHNSLGK